jgi:N-acyl-D-amino-acid deacylase
MSDGGRCDLILRGGQLADPASGTWRSGDLAVADGTIAAIGSLGALRACEELALDGLVVAPGFVDLHTHSDLSLLHHPAAESKLMQGVTTEVVGNCGFSAFPAPSARLRSIVELLRSIDAEPRVDWLDLPGYRRALIEAQPAVNVASLVGHGTLRLAVMGADERPPSRVEMDRMRGLLAEALGQGTLGLSTGLTYVPSRFADAAEVEALAGAVAEVDALYATHARADASRPRASYEEAFEVGRRTGARVQYSHVAINEPARWGQADQVLAWFEHAATQGVDVRFDVYPYEASASALTQYLPAWVQEGGVESMRERLADSIAYERAARDLASGFYGGIPWDWGRVVVSTGPPEALGEPVARLADEAGKAPEKLVLDLCLRSGNAVQVILFYRQLEDVRRFIAHPFSLIGSDGNAVPLEATEGKPHPRAFGTYARVLERFVPGEGHDELLTTLGKMSWEVAKRLGLRDRGRLEVGQAADLVVFDPAAVADVATYVHPYAAPRGIEHVVVNGDVAVRGGRLTGARAGQWVSR